MKMKKIIVMGVDEALHHIQNDKHHKFTTFNVSQVRENRR